MNRHKQTGMTALGWLIVLGLIGFFALVTIRVTPMYLESFNVSGALESLKSEPLVTQKSIADINRLLQRRFDVNDIEHVNPKTDVKVEKQEGILKVTIAYEARTHLLGNLDVVGVFDKHIEIIGH